MQIIGLNGSPDKEGNTAFLLNKVLETAGKLGAKTSVINVGEVLKSTASCFCTVCSSPCSGACYKGTKMEEAYELISQADGLVLGSPVYFGSISAQMKAFFDKSRKLRAEKKLYNKVAAGVTSGTSRYGGQETTIKTLHDIMLVQGMIIIGDGFRDDDCGHHGVCAQRPANSDAFALTRAEILGKRMYEVCEATKELRR